MKETKSGRFELGDDSLTIQAIVDFMYTKQYSLTTNADDFSELLQLHINIRIAADYYGVVGLAEYAEKRFLDAFIDWQNIKNVLPDVVRTIYAKDCRAVEGIRNKVLRVTLDNMAELELNQNYWKLFDEVRAFTRQLFFTSRAAKPLSTYGILKTECHFCCSTIEIVVKGFQANIHCPLCGVANYASSLRRRQNY
ncbi:hypothetical protein SLS56_010089 [Neofusicoccum ribis]|uniref:BTB domain-containing protein n=1 Tax=Neofusicoccum ribis TaxID=45134 RepID=A0ABR3SFD9_9PEZI